MIAVFEVQLGSDYTAEQYAQYWIEASKSIVRTTGIRRMRLYRSPARPGQLLAIVSWASGARLSGGPHLKMFINAQSCAQVELRVVGEFEDPEWEVVPGAFDWEGWERRIVENGVTLDRPRGSRHPVHSQIVYSINYGYVNETISSDGEEVDVFVGSANTGLVAVIHTVDHGKGDEEDKLLWNCTPEEVYLVNGFLNFDRTRMEGTLQMREPFERLWEGARAPS